MTSLLTFYSEHSPITDPGRHRPLFDALPGDVAAIVSAVQGLLMHPAAAKLHGEPPEEDDGWGYLTMAETLERILALDAAPLVVARPPSRRLRGNCRNFAVLCVAILRHHGVPSRRRVGWANYLPGPRLYFHEIAEYWNAAQRRWVLVDPQNDAVTIAAQKAFFASIGQPERGEYHTLDILRDEQLVLGGTAWRRCRAGPAGLDAFHRGDGHVWRELQIQMLQDLDSVSKAELLSNDSGLFPGQGAGDPTDEMLPLLDRVADLLADPDRRFDELRELYAATPYGRWAGEKLAALAPA